MLDKSILKVAKDHSKDFSLTLQLANGNFVSGNVFDYDETAGMITMHQTGTYTFIPESQVACFAGINYSFYQAILAEEKRSKSAEKPDVEPTPQGDGDVRIFAAPYSHNLDD